MKEREQYWGPVFSSLSHHWQLHHVLFYLLKLLLTPSVWFATGFASCLLVIHSLDTLCAAQNIPAPGEPSPLTALST